MSGDDKNIAIAVKNLKKSFKLPHEKHSGIKQYLVNIFRSESGYEMQHVLKGISFDIHEGDFFGIVGRNGSGKSTLLKLLSGIYSPNEGSVQVEGTLVPFIELGVGFNPELTGRENIFLSGALLGFSRAEMNEKYDSIVKFSELEYFMDQKLKNYSSGMQVRLAFSIAIRAKGDILLLDEVLAVGDEAFQRKCFNYFNKLKREKKTVILVTHDMGSVERFCNKAMFLEDGEVKLIGKPHEVAAAYSKSNDKEYIKQQDALAVETNKEQPFSIKLLNDSGKETSHFEMDERLHVELTWKQDGVKSAGVALFAEGGEYICGTNTYIDNYSIKKGNRLVQKVVLNLNEGRYFLKASINGVNDLDRIAFIDNGPFFTISRKPGSPRWQGITKLNYEWE